MKRMALLSLLFAAIAYGGCDSNSNTVSHGREAVKEVVTQPFNTLNAASDSLKQNEEKAKAALEQADKESQ